MTHVHSSWQWSKLDLQCKTLSCDFFFCNQFLFPFLTFFCTFVFTKHCTHCHSCFGRISVCAETHQSQHAWLLSNLGDVSFSYLLSSCLQTSHHLLIYSIYVHREWVDTQMNMYFQCDDTDPHLNTQTVYCLYWNIFTVFLV